MYSSFFIVLCDYFHLNSVSHQGELGRRRTIGIQRLVVAGAEEGMSLRIKAVVDKFVQELKEALDADIQDRIMKEREMQSYIQEALTEIARQEARLKMERENLEKEKSVLMGTASNQDNQDGALEITVSGEKYRCLRFAKAKK
ncbi:hypothetical protein LOK49_LG07G00307 [Camellia lanceoleosa]|uniref:Uncharacterized protein n=1 Tax=Camellia lanceoleosa TaxID=1840588 RepID=A0ACC0H3X2_9ERIC|nr:hypothetical protein LOK49_LG07G00307 [Camellia lanceoleosa]